MKRFKNSEKVVKAARKLEQTHRKKIDSIIAFNSALVAFVKLHEESATSKELDLRLPVSRNMIERPVRG